MRAEPEQANEHCASEIVALRKDELIERSELRYVARFRAPAGSYSHLGRINLFGRTDVVNLGTFLPWNFKSVGLSGVETLKISQWTSEADKVLKGSTLRAKEQGGS